MILCPGNGSFHPAGAAAWENVIIGKKERATTSNINLRMSHMLCAAVEIGKNFGHGGTVEGVWVSHRPSWIGGVAAPKAQTGWLFKFDKRNPSIWNNHPGATSLNAPHSSYPGGAIARILPVRSSRTLRPLIRRFGYKQICPS